VGITETMKVAAIELAPVFADLDAQWWELQKRFTLTMRGHRPDSPVRVMRFYTRRARTRAMNRYLDAHRRVYGWFFSTGAGGIGFESLS
jgi:hypothetical protein